MAPAVSDAGPLIHLAQIGKLFLLKKLFKHVLITPRVGREVVDEGIRLGYADALIVKQAINEGWITITDVSKTEPSATQRLAEGEKISLSDAETLLLAKEHEAEAVLVDEKVLTDLARMYGFKVANTWTLLLEALSQRLIEVQDIESAIDELAKQKHKLRPEHASEILEAARLIDSKALEKPRHQPQD